MYKGIALQEIWTLTQEMIEPRYGRPERLEITMMPNRARADGFIEAMRTTTPTWPSSSPSP